MNHELTYQSPHDGHPQIRGGEAKERLPEDVRQRQASPAPVGGRSVSVEKVEKVV